MGSRASVYARLDSQLAELRTRFGGLPSPDESAYVWADIWHLEAHHSTALEGNTLVLREVETLLDQGKAVGAKPLRESRTPPRRNRPATSAATTSTPSPKA